MIIEVLELLKNIGRRCIGRWSVFPNDNIAVLTARNDHTLIIRVAARSNFGRGRLALSMLRHYLIWIINCRADDCTSGWMSFDLPADKLDAIVITENTLNTLHLLARRALWFLVFLRD